MCAEGRLSLGDRDFPTSNPSASRAAPELWHFWSVVFWHFVVTEPSRDFHQALAALRGVFLALARVPGSSARSWEYLCAISLALMMLQLRLGAVRGHRQVWRAQRACGLLTTEFRKASLRASDAQHIHVLALADLIQHQTSGCFGTGPIQGSALHRVYQLGSRARY